MDSDLEKQFYQDARIQILVLVSMLEVTILTIHLQIYLIK